MYEIQWLQVNVRGRHTRPQKWRRSSAE